MKPHRRHRTNMPRHRLPRPPPRHIPPNNSRTNVRDGHTHIAPASTFPVHTHPARRHRPTTACAACADTPNTLDNKSRGNPY